MSEGTISDVRVNIVIPREILRSENNSPEIDYFIPITSAVNLMPNPISKTHGSISRKLSQNLLIPHIQTDMTKIKCRLGRICSIAIWP